MAASREDIARWFERGFAEKKKYLLVVCDTFNYEDYPVFADSDEDCQKQYDEHNGKNMQAVMEIYNLHEDMIHQMNQFRCWSLPKGFIR